MKRLLQAFSIFIFLLLLVVFCSAHKGNTDANGGHFDNNTGLYHYHHGYPAHQHTDGQCPYDYDDKTNHSQGSSSNDESKIENQNKKDNETKNESVSKRENETEKQSKKSITNNKFILIVIGFTILLSLCGYPFECIVYGVLTLLSDSILKKVNNENHKKIIQRIFQIISITFIALAILFYSWWLTSKKYDIE